MRGFEPLRALLPKALPRVLRHPQIAKAASAPRRPLFLFVLRPALGRSFARARCDVLETVFRYAALRQMDRCVPHLVCQCDKLRLGIALRQVDLARQFSREVDEGWRV